MASSLWWSVLFGLVLGCQARSTPAPTPTPEPSSGPAEWRLTTVGQTDRPAPGHLPGAVLADLAFEFAGPAGFARITLDSEFGTPDSPPTSHLNDVLFPVAGPTRLVAVVNRPAKQVEFRVASGAAESTATVELKAPFSQSKTHSELIANPGAMIVEGREVELGRWVVGNERDRSTLTVRILLSRRPTGPRLKPEGKPPV